MTTDAWFIIVLLGSAAAFALLEIQIEGEAGWASNLPTWRIENDWTRKLLGARAITGYHVYWHLLIISIVHLGFALGAPWSLKSEARIVAFLIFFWIIEDFLWFVFHPRFGLARFRRQNIWWHADSWWWFMPRDYWLFLPIGVALFWVAR